MPRSNARHIEPAPAAFEDAVSRSLGFHPLEPVPQRFVLLIDTFEALEPLGSWLFEQFVPSMPDCSVMVLASRNGKLSPPSALAPLAYTIRLRNLEPAESHEFLDRRNIESAERDSLIAASFGHPLALSIAADTLVQAGRIGPLERLNIVRTLLDRLIEFRHRPRRIGKHWRSPLMLGSPPRRSSPKRSMRSRLLRCSSGWLACRSWNSAPTVCFRMT